MNSTEIGKWGENEALLYLQKQGFTFIEANYHSRFGEIDLIVENDSMVVFAEVKTRENDKFASAAEAVDKKKMSKIVITAGGWIVDTDCKKQPRFDVIEVYPHNGYTAGTSKINHIANAFSAQCGR